MNATLVVESLGSINVTSNVPGSVVTINGESHMTDPNGNYIWILVDGAYDVTVSKESDTL